ncbi:hypothetical protein Q2T42_00015 [Leptolyngbya boryana CZ1]|uniref:Uncharacterized protein n=1 Tax=Leptolyngbya boryana CZ1 TaxID=3060204 RepID=A0AA97ANY2_LEPBY|nr:hypothetical protein [Leptolyngbya boryana]WNZ46223.1 hypothetical protein Q2T42_00015 [Leptolyngbya boryana CZ1]
MLELEKPNLHEKETLVLEEDPAEFETEPEPSQVPISNLSSNPLPDLAVSTRYSEEPIALLSQLPPARLLQELLGRVLCEGIDGCTLSDKQDMGAFFGAKMEFYRLLIEGCSSSQIPSFIRRIERINPPSPKLVTQVREVEIERLYQRDRVLLRLRLMPTEMGEQANPTSITWSRFEIPSTPTGHEL